MLLANLVRSQIPTSFFVIEILNISEIVWFDYMIYISIGSSSSFWKLILILIDFEKRYVILSRLFKHSLNSKVVYFFFI